MQLTAGVNAAPGPANQTDYGNHAAISGAGLMTVRCRCFSVQNRQLYAAEMSQHMTVIMESVCSAGSQVLIAF